MEWCDRSRPPRILPFLLAALIGLVAGCGAPADPSVSKSTSKDVSVLGSWSGAELDALEHRHQIILGQDATGPTPLQEPGEPPLWQTVPCGQGRYGFAHASSRADSTSQGSNPFTASTAVDGSRDSRILSLSHVASGPISKARASDERASDSSSARARHAA